MTFKPAKALWTAAMVLLCGAWAAAQAAAPASGEHSPQAMRELMRRVSESEVKANDDRERLTYRMRDETPQETTVRAFVETKDGLTLGRTLLVNGAPPNAARQQKDEARLQKLLSDPSVVADKRKAQKRDEQRIQTMMKALPDAFTFEYEGTEAGGTGQLIRVNFQPDPNFNPPNRETQILGGMQGTLWIDAKDERMEHIDARLVREVNFGWGILGHLDRGGSFDVRQRKIGDRWEIDQMTLNFTGTILMFKSFVKKEKQVYSDFRIIPELPLAEAVALLNKERVESAAGNGNKKVREAQK